MDETGRSIVSQTCLKVTGEIYASLCDVSQGFQPDVVEAIYKKIWQLHQQTMKAAVAPPPGDPGPFDQPAQPVDPMVIPPPPPDAPTPAPQSQPAAQPSQPQPVMQGPPCPTCGTPTVMTKDYPAKKARNMSEGKKPPPMWKCPMGSYDRNTGPQGCQGSIWEPDGAMA